MNITFLASFVDSIKSWFTGWFGAILSFIPKIFYQLMSMIFAILDLLQYLVRKFAGLDNMAATAAAAENANASGDLALYMINLIFNGGTVLTTVFWSMIILGVFMLALTTFIAVIKSEYTATSAKDAAKGPILINALKGLMSFVVVPITCFFGLYLGNLILQLVDKLTNVNVSSQDAMSQYEEVSSADGQTTYYNYSIFGIKIPTTNTPISGIIFQSAAYGCNRARTNAHRFYSVLTENDKVNLNGAFYQMKNESEAAQEYNASLIDEAFANTYKLKQKTDLDRSPFISSHMFPVNLSATFTVAESIMFDSNAGIQYLDKNNTILVWYYYDLWSFDYITCIAALIVVTKLLIDLALGLIKRVFELTMLFLIAAPMASLRPLDGGQASKQWTSQFVSKAIGVFGPIAGLNLFFIILSILTQIKITGFTVIDKFIQILFVIVGLVTVKDLTGMISKFVGGEDTLSSGSGISGAVAETAGKVAKVGMAFAGGAGFAMKHGSVGMAGRALGKTEAGQAAKRKFNAAKSHFNKDLGDERALAGYIAENGIDANDADAVAAAQKKVSDMGRSERHKYISSANKNIKNDAVREKLGKKLDKEWNNNKNAVREEYDSQDGHELGDFNKLDAATQNELIGLRVNTDSARAKYDAEHGAGAFDHLSKFKGAKGKAEQNRLINEAAAEREKALETGIDTRINPTLSWNKASKKLDKLNAKESKQAAKESANYEKWLEQKATEMYEKDYEGYGMPQFADQGEEMREKYLKEVTGKYSKEDYKKEMAEASKKPSAASQIILGDDTKKGIVGAIKEGFGALKDMVKDSTSGIAGGMVSTVVKPFKLDKDSKKEAAEKAKLEAKEAAAGKAAESRNTEIIKAINELKSSLTSSSTTGIPTTTKLDKESVKEIGKAIADSLKNNKN